MRGHLFIGTKQRPVILQSCRGYRHHPEYRYCCGAQTRPPWACHHWESGYCGRDITRSEVKVLSPSLMLSPSRSEASPPFRLGVFHTSARQAVAQVTAGSQTGGPRCKGTLLPTQTARARALCRTGRYDITEWVISQVSRQSWQVFPSLRSPSTPPYMRIWEASWSEYRSRAQTGSTLFQVRPIEPNPLGRVNAHTGIIAAFQRLCR